MKARAVAGDLERATKFLNELQQVDWRRYGQSGRSKKDLRQMRMRLEKEQGAGHPLKAGLGGFYDIDFSLLYLRLKSAGIFFKVLNTPARIDIIEAMGHLERADARVSARRGHVLSRHGSRAARVLGPRRRQLAELRIAASGSDGAGAALDPGASQPAAAQSGAIQNRTREIFERLFS